MAVTTGHMGATGVLLGGRVSLDPVYVWVCPNRCGQEYRTKQFLPNRFHTCPKLRGLMTVPMVLEGTRAKVEANEREDYIGKEHVQLDPERGRPVMNVKTTRDDGEDIVVFAPSAVAKGDAT